MVDLRLHQRASVDTPVEFGAKGSTELFAGRARDVSHGGMFIETTHLLDFSAEIIVHITLPKARGKLALRGIVRWTRADGMGVQFGLLGARETHAITELAKERQLLSKD